MIPWVGLWSNMQSWFFQDNYHQNMTPSSSMDEPLFLNPFSTAFQTHGLENKKEDTETTFGWTESSLPTMELRSKILAFRDILELPPYNTPSDLTHLAVRTTVDLYKLYPNMVRINLSSSTHKDSMTQSLVFLNIALMSVEKLWGLRKDEEESLRNIERDKLVKKLLARLTFLITSAKEMFGIMDEDEEDEEIESNRKVQSTLGDIYSRKSVTSSFSDVSPSIFPEFTPTMNPQETRIFPLSSEYTQTQNSSIVDEIRETANQLNAEDQVAEEGHKKVSFEGPNEDLNPENESNGVPEARNSTTIFPPPAPPPPPVGMLSALSMAVLRETRTPPPTTTPLSQESETPSPPTPPPELSLTTTTSTSMGSEAVLPPPPPSPMAQTEGGAPPPPPLMAEAKGGAPPPPPPLNMVKVVLLKRVASKLRRSTQMSNLYRHLKGKVEGSSLKVSNSSRAKTKMGGQAPRGKQGMAEALTEIAQRSSYFKMIEEDLVKHKQLVLELKAAITSFQTKDMDELIEFHKHVEENLEKLTDETQVLPKFEGFPLKKLESLRVAAALYLKLKGILNELQKWKVEPPLEQLLNKVESYFDKIKGDLEITERSKDDHSKQFQSNNIHFDFGILVKIKESLVDVSSSCMELALKEEREETQAASSIQKGKNCVQVLWRAFQLAFRVYSFAGGQDDRADKLSMEVAQQIETEAEQE